MAPSVSRTSRDRYPALALRGRLEGGGWGCRLPSGFSLNFGCVRCSVAQRPAFRRWISFNLNETKCSTPNSTTKKAAMLGSVMSRTVRQNRESKQITIMDSWNRKIAQVETIPAAAPATTAPAPAHSKDFHVAPISNSEERETSLLSAWRVAEHLGLRELSERCENQLTDSTVALRTLHTSSTWALSIRLKKGSASVRSATDSVIGSFDS